MSTTPQTERSHAKTPQPGRGRAGVPVRTPSTARAVGPLAVGDRVQANRHTGAKLAALRRAARPRLSQEELGGLVGVSRHAIVRIEGGGGLDHYLYTEIVRVLMRGRA